MELQSVKTKIYSTLEIKVSEQSLEFTLIMGLEAGLFQGQQMWNRLGN